MFSQLQGREQLISLIHTARQAKSCDVDGTRVYTPANSTQVFVLSRNMVVCQE